MTRSWGPGTGSRRVLLAVEQLRREIPGGIGRYAVGLLDGLRELEADGTNVSSPSLSLLVSRSPGGRGEPDPLAPWGIPILSSRLPSRLLTRAWDHGWLAAPRGFDVVHSVSLAFPRIGRRRTPAGRGITALSVVVHDVAWRLFPEATTNRGRHWHEAALRRAMAQADALIVPSTPVAEELGGLGAKGSITVVPLGSDHLPPPDVVTTDALLHRCGIGGPFLLTAGTVEPRKNLDRLFAAYEAARSSLPEPWPLVVVGPKGWGVSGASRAGASPPPGVIGVGEVSDGVLAGLYAKAAMFAYVPLTEGYGLPPVEAMTFGVPVLVSNGVPSVDVEAPGTPVAVRADPLDVDAIAAGMVRACTDETLRAELAVSGKAFAAERTWREVAHRTESVWAGLA